MDITYRLQFTFPAQHCEHRFAVRVRLPHAQAANLDQHIERARIFARDGVQRVIRNDHVRLDAALCRDLFAPLFQMLEARARVIVERWIAARARMRLRGLRRRASTFNRV